MKKIPLFPSNFKWIALILIIINLLLLFVFRDSIGNIDSESRRITFKEIVVSIANVGLLILLFSKKEYDDEMLMYLRLVTICGGVLMIVVFLLVISIIDYIENTGLNGINSWTLFTMLFFVNIMFEWQCRKLKKHLDEE